MNILDKLNEGNKILIIPAELKNYFYEIRENDPFLDFKIFTIRELISELRGNYLKPEVINLAFNYFPELTYSSIKEVSELVFSALDLEKSNDQDLLKLRDDLIENGLLKDNEDLKILIRSKEVIFINYENSTLVSRLIEWIGLTNYSFMSLKDVVESTNDVSYHRFFNIADETYYALNEIMQKIDKGISPSQIDVILDTKRFDYYLNLLMEGYDVPYEIEGTKSLLETRTFKYIYKYLDDSNCNILDILNEKREEINDEENIDSIINVLEKFNIDHLNNKKTNVIEILSSRRRNDEKVINTIRFGASLTFSKRQKIFVLGLDSTFIPKAKKDNKVYSYKFRNLIGLDSLDEVNLMKSRLEEAFLTQKNITFISFHQKDNNGRYNLSYYIDAFKMKKVKNEVHQVEYSEKAMRYYYRLLLDKFNRSGTKNDTLLAYKHYFNNEILENYSPRFKGLTDFKFNENTKFSYSSLDKYNDCPFKYYASYYLKDNAFEGTFESKAGNLAHAILEHVYEHDFDFETLAKEKYLEQVNRGETYDIREQILLKRFLLEVKRTSNFILEHRKNMHFDKTFSEMKVFANIEFEDEKIVNKNGKNELIKVSSTAKVEGRIDRIIQLMDDSLYIIDYKSGDDSFKQKDFVNYQKSLQLPFYRFLIENSGNKELLDKRIAGLFIQPLLMKGNNFFNLFSPSEDDKKTVYLKGLCLNDIDIINKFDTTLISEEQMVSQFVAGVKKVKSGQLGKSGASTSIETFNEYVSLVKKLVINSYRNIENGNFEINPINKRTEINYDPCAYCNFKDICLTKVQKEEE